MGDASLGVESGFCSTRNSLTCSSWVAKWTESREEERELGARVLVRVVGECAGCGYGFAA